MNTTFAVGDTVHYLPNLAAMFSAYGTFTVVRVPVGRQQVNYDIKPVEGGRGRRTKGEYLEAGPAPTTPVAVPTRTYTAPLESGTVVTFAGKPGLWVVTGQTPKGNQVFPLGGSTRYFTGVSPKHLTVVTEISEWSAS